MKNADLSKDSLLKLLESFVTSEKELRDNVALYHDLSIHGDDADDLIASVSKFYGTTFEGYNAALYFPDEVDGFYYHIAKLFGYRGAKWRRLTIGHLREVIAQGKWFDPA